MIKIYNTLSKNKETFKPIQKGQVNIYVCGMTVYDLCHIGHARVMVIFDMVRRWFDISGFQVNYIRNITDIDDKIISRALQNNESIQSLTERYIEEMNADAKALGVIKPSKEPKATEHIEDMLFMIQTLIEKQHAYVAKNGDVFYKVRSFDGYGKLSGKSIEDLRAGERVDVDQNKNDELDFVLWKSAKPNEPSWDSPWGKGRPGWHIECSAMSSHYLGHHFDIHGGGQDLQFPHHENEIAQSEGAHDCKMANYWMHNGFVRVDEEKMSKSLGNFFTIRTVLEKFDAEVVRFFILRAHYRSPLNYSDAHLEDAKIALQRLYVSLRGMEINHMEVDWNHPLAVKFKEAMDDDFNSPEAISILFELANEINKNKSLSLASLLKGLAKMLGLLERDPEIFLKGDAKNSFDIDEFISKRHEAKLNKDFKEADRIRSVLLENGVVLEDTPQGTIWRKE
ncbi:cysteine--tRNA ligase [Methylophilaceae bacterium]|nr:cysteine--tRNA ligase [Methylophilaceae bacterium]